MSWTVAKLGEVCKIVSGSTPSRVKPELWDGGVFWITPKDLDESRILELYESPETISDKGLASCSTQILPVDSVLFSSRAPIGLVAINKVPLCTNQGFKSLVPGEKIHYKYLAYWLKAHKLQLQAMGNGATFKELSKSIFEKVEIPLPPLPIQKKIAAVLEKADELRRKREEQIKRLDDLLQATFLDMFGDPVTNPKGWMKYNLESLCCKVTDGTHQPPKFVSEGIPFLFVSNIVNGFIDFETEKFISETTFYELTSRTPIEVGDILYSTVGSYGKAVLVDTTKKFSFQRHIAHIKPDPQKIQPEFLLAQLNSDGVKRQADSLARGIAQKTLNLRELKGFEIFLPPHEKQIEFIKWKKKIDDVTSVIKGSCGDNQTLFNSLMQRAFKGELDLV